MFFLKWIIIFLMLMSGQSISSFIKNAAFTEKSRTRVEKPADLEVFDRDEELAEIKAMEEEKYKNIFSEKADKYEKPLSVEDAQKLLIETVHPLKNEFIDYDLTDDEGKYWFRYSTVTGEMAELKERLSVDPKTGELEME